MKSNKLTVKDSALSFLIGFLLCQISVVALTCVALVGFKIFNADTNNFFIFLNTASGYMLSSLALYFTMLFVFLFFNKEKENKITAKVSVKKLIFYISIAVVSFLTLYPIIVCVDSLLVKCGITLGTIPYELTTKNYFISLISLVIAPAICEELLFRGIIFSGLKKHGKILAISVSAVMFCVYHMSISQTVYPLLIGLLLGVIMYYEANIYYCIAVHMTNNFLSLTLSYFNINLVFNHWSYIVLAITLAISFITTILVLIIKNRKNIEKEPISKNEKLILVSTIIAMILLWIITNFI